MDATDAGLTLLLNTEELTEVGERDQRGWERGYGG